MMVYRGPKQVLRNWTLKKTPLLLLILIAGLSFCLGSDVEAGTWSHQILKQETKPWGIEVIVRFTRDVTGEQSVHTFRFDSQKQVDHSGATRLANKKARLELSYSILNRFDIGENSQEILRALIVQIRNNPTATISQAITWYDTNYPNALWKGSQFFQRGKEKIEEETGQTVTWDQFKTYVINHVFEAIDG